MRDPVPLDPDLLRSMPLPHVPEDGDKEARGRLLVIAGSRELAGAALLAGTAGLRAGAGKLQIGTAPPAAVALGLAVPEARVIAWDEERGIDALVARAAEAQAVVAGCGMDGGEGLERLLGALLDRGEAMPLVLDAAALHCLPEIAPRLRGWAGVAVLLPHAGEAARLLGTNREEVAADPCAAALRLAREFGAVAVVKSARTAVAAPDGRIFLYPGGGIGLATSGSGDVLAGIVGGLAARGADALCAASWGVWLHGEAGRRLRKRIGRLGFLARELIDEIPALLDGKDSIHAEAKAL